MKNKFLAGLATGLFVLGIVGISNAALITTNNISNPTIIDFSTQTTVQNVSGPIQIGGLVNMDITVTGSPNTGLYTNYDGWGLGNNGTWGGGMTYVSADDAHPGSLIIAFKDSPVSAVGGFMNHLPGSYDLSISALDSSMNVLESYNITALANIVTPGGYNDGAFRGIERGVSDISFFEITGYVPVLDDLTFSSQVPVPGAVWLLGSGIAGLVGLRRKKKT